MIQCTRTTANQIQRTPTGRPGIGCQSHGTSRGTGCPFSTDNSLGYQKLGACSSSSKRSRLRHTGGPHLPGHDQGSVGHRNSCQLCCGEDLQGPLMVLAELQQAGLVTLAVQTGHPRHSGSSETG
ncbi:MAG: hypothetical protein TQ37_06970 [Candidatus Synechococcus spongiarum 15L]|uniref:Uncharacterized protein n=1 Tax=Candidatus Synechococcus spongiarum 15L TaxID=1608419 RepID=A0A0G8ATN4_9SYNE|nr:MAG: hypothetical protein TQ37_06970 [Candidatus Synechococcus spongiarum 15L]